MTYKPRVAGVLDATQGFGLVGDGVADDTSAVNAALARGAAEHRVVHFGAAVCKITGSLTMTGPGLVFDTVPHGGSGGPGLKVTGTGYTALTVGPGAILSDFRVCVYGTGNAANGISFNNPLLSRVPQVRVYNLAGFGVSIDKCWDCVFDTVSIEKCGTAAAYAFSMNDAGDVCNCSVVTRLQVEQATTQAIYISPNTLACRFGLIHSEQLTSPDASTWGWVLGGNSCDYSTIRLESNATDTNARVWFNAAYTNWTNVRVEGGIQSQVTGWNGRPVTFVNPTMGTAFEQTNQTGKITVLGGRITGWTGNTSNRTLYNTALT